MLSEKLSSRIFIALVNRALFELTVMLFNINHHGNQNKTECRSHVIAGHFSASFQNIPAMPSTSV